jgi:hypothetical protein
MIHPTKKKKKKEKKEEEMIDPSIASTSEFELTFKVHIMHRPP